MKQPEGFSDGDRSDKVCRLQKSLYGLKQAPRQWNVKFRSFLEKFGLRRSDADNCVYVANENNHRTILGIYVDDGLLVSTSKVKIKEIVKALQKEFEMSIGVVDCFLGLQVVREEKVLVVHQEAYIRRMLTKYGMEDCKPVRTPMDASNKLVKAESNACKYPYREIVGSLMYAMLGSRPDIAYAV
ncbi:gag-pol polyprotein-like protein, partial [Leptotrombidium deliense]